MGKKNYVIYTPKEESEKMAALAKKYCTKKSIIKIADLSCGSGNLLEALHRSLESPHEGYGYDVDIEAIALAKKRFIKQSFHFCCRDSLYLDTKLRFDIILGNPPYLGEKNHKEIFTELRKTPFGEKYYEAKMDYLYFFLEKACELLEEEGILVYLTTNYWLRADGAKTLRKCLEEEGDFLFFEDYNASLFEGALGQHDILFVWRKGKKKENVCIQDEKGIFYLEQKDLYQQAGKIFLWREDIRKRLYQMKERSNSFLGDLLEIKQGIVSGCDKAFVFSKYEEELRDYLKPFYKNKDIFSYQIRKQEEFWILYLDEKISRSPMLEKYLEPYRSLLEKRREVKNGRLDWWKLQWSREEKLFTSPKIVGRQRCKGNWFAYAEEEMYGSADIYYFLPRNPEVDLFYILAFLNSDLFSFWYFHCGKRKGNLYEFYTTPLQEVPIYYPEKEEREPISELAREQIKKFSQGTQKKINNFFQKIERNV